MVWALAAAALTFGNALIAEQAEPYFLLLSAVLVAGVAVWMFVRTWHDVSAAQAHAHAHHDHDDHQHGHPHSHGASAALADGAYQDAHERAHAQDIARRFAGKRVTTGQIALFGLTGGLVPCPASVTILMVCLHLKRFSLGAAMVASFSLGLAIALVGVGMIAAWGLQHAGERLGPGRFGDLARKMPYFSSALMLLVGLIMGTQALLQIAGR